jgi:hypothetical protein
MEPSKVLIWGLVLPLVAAGLILGVSWRVWKREGSAPRWSAALAMLAGLATSHLALVGYQAPRFDVTHWILLFAAAGAVWGLIASLLPTPEWLRWVVRVAAAGLASYLLLGPLLAQQLPVSRVIALAGAFFVVWSGLDRLAQRGAGPLFVLVSGLLFAGGSAAVIFSGNATSALAVSGAGGVLAIAFLIALRRPEPGALRSLVPALSLALVAQWALGLFYTDAMSVWTFALLALAPALVVAASLTLTNARASIAVAVQLLILLAPVGGAVALTAARYFAPAKAAVRSRAAGHEPSSASSSSPSTNGTKESPAGSDDDYGY